MNGTKKKGSMKDLWASKDEKLNQTEKIPGFFLAWYFWSAVDRVVRGVAPDAFLTSNDGNRTRDLFSVFQSLTTLKPLILIFKVFCHFYDGILGGYILQLF